MWVAKVPVVIRAGTQLEISASGDEEVLFRWGDQEKQAWGERLVIAGCGDQEDGWLVFPGSVASSSKACVELDVDLASEVETVLLSLGAACLSQ